MSFSGTPILPPAGGFPLRACILGRKSQPNEGNENESIEASIQNVEDFLSPRYSGPLEVTRLGEQISGLVYGRETILTVEDLMDRRAVDLILVEDLGRLFRNPRDQFTFVQNCVDAGVRFISVVDQLDTATENWESSLMVAAARHGFATTDCRNKVRRSATFAFKKGGNVLKVRFGYRKLTRDEAKSGRYGPVGLCVVREDQWTAIVEEMAARVIRGESYRQIADWLNAEGVPVGPYVLSNGWTGKLVREFLSDPILMGCRRFRITLSHRKFNGGKKIRCKNPEGPLVADHPQLAHLQVDRFDELQKAMAQRAALLKGQGSLSHPRTGIPRSRVLFPGQHVRCGICGQLMHAYGDSQYKCQASFRERTPRCWNHVQVDGRLCCERVLIWLVDQASKIPGFRERLIDAVCAEVDQIQSTGDRAKDGIKRRVDGLVAQQRRFAKAISKAGELDPLIEKIVEVERQLVAARREHESQQRKGEGVSAYISRAAVVDRLDNALKMLSETSFEFGVMLRQFITRLDIVPVQAIDSGLVRARAYVTLSFAPGESENSGPHEIHGVIDLFDPPLHIAYLEACRTAQRECPADSLKTIATKLGINHMTVKRALDLSRRLEREGLATPYRELRDPPEYASRWRHA